MSRRGKTGGTNFIATIVSKSHTRYAIVITVTGRHELTNRKPTITYVTTWIEHA